MVKGIDNWEIDTYNKGMVNNELSPSKIRMIRKALKETQTVFGKRFFVTRRTVCNWENGSTPPEPLAKEKLLKLVESHKDLILGD